MPPIKQISKQQMLDKAYELVRNEGYPSMTARRLAKELNCSTQPIYQAFADMKELKSELVKKAQANLLTYIKDNCNPDLPKEVACILAYIRFAREEKHLFQLIFTSGGLDMNAMNDGTMSMNLDMNMIIYANGIVMMQAFHTINFTDDILTHMLLHAYELFTGKR